MTIAEIKQLVANEEAFKEYCEKQIVKVAEGIKVKSYLDAEGKEVAWGIGNNKNIHILHVKDKFMIDHYTIENLPSVKYVYSYDGYIVSEEEFYELLKESEGE